MNAISKLVIQFYLAVTGLVLFTSRSASKRQTEKNLHFFHSWRKFHMLSSLD